MAKTKDLFDQAFLDEMSEALSNEQKKLEDELSRIHDHVEYGDSEEENAHEVTDDEVNRQLVDRLEKSLRDVESALKRMADGTYGICKFTGEKISEERLRARPTSSTTAEAKKVVTGEA
ncbi:TraR/DksA family transcriptional regulator [Candidatus Nomurabacteria bacterium]|nr:TraR/DksA family transcriptional regulator [Candidatus Nomurabacteria bacterium]